MIESQRHSISPYLYGSTMKQGFAESVLTLPLLSHHLAVVQRDRLQTGVSNPHAKAMAERSKRRMCIFSQPARMYRCAGTVSVLITNIRSYLELSLCKDMKDQSLSAYLCIQWWLQYSWWSWGYFQHRSHAKAAHQIHGGLHGYHDWHW